MFTTKKHFLHLVFCLLVLILSGCADIQQPDVSYSFSVARDVEYGVDEFESIGFEPGAHLDLGFYEGNVWIKLEIENTAEQSSYVILCGDLINRKYQFFRLDRLTDRLVTIDPARDMAFHDHRTYNFSKPNFQIDLAPREKATYFITTASDGRILQASPRLITFNEFQDIRQRTVIFDIVFYGSVAILLLINFLYFQSVKSNIYYFYGPYILSACLMYLFVEGRLYGLGWSHSLIDHLMFISIRIWILTGVLFTMRFLKIRKSSPRFYRFILGFLAVSLGITTSYQLLFSETSISHLHMTENLLGFIWIVFSLTMVGISFKKQKLEAKYFLIAYASLLIFVTLGLIDSHTTLLPGDPFSYFKIGTILEFIGFTYFIVLLIKRRIQTNEQLERDLNETRTVLGEKEKQLDANSRISKTDFANIFKLVESSLTTEEDWKEFKLRFEALQPDFYSRLINAYPALTKSEVRLVMLIHIGYSQKEIAAILNIAPDSVKKGRTRLRRKLSVPVDVRFEEFLLQFSGK